MRATTRGRQAEAVSAKIQAERPFNSTQALREAARCLQCFDAPCARACPAGIVIPRFIRMIRSGNIRGAAEVVRSSNPMALSCGIACPDEQLCAAACLRAAIDEPISIRRLHRFANDHEEEAVPRTPEIAPQIVGRAGRPVRVAVVGGGPAGLACAFELRRRGISVTLFEKRERVGGVLSSTIPLYRFPEKVIQRDAAWSLGVERVGFERFEGKGANRNRGAARRPGPQASVTLKLEDPVEDIEALSGEYDAVFIASGLVVQDSRLPGSDLRGVEPATEFLERCRKTRYATAVGEAVVIIGGGNVAVDAAMAAVCCGELNGGPPPRVSILYRRSREEMPAWDREVREAEQAGVLLHFLVAPVGFEGSRGRLRGVRLCRTTLGLEDATGRRTAVPVPSSEFVMPCDTAILATGMRLDRRPFGHLPVTRIGLIRTDRGTKKVRSNIFAGGDVANPDQTIVAAVRDGKLAARAIADLLAAGRKAR